MMNEKGKAEKIIVKVESVFIKEALGVALCLCALVAIFMILP
jgi:hypothetical protein